MTIFSCRFSVALAVLFGLIPSTRAAQPLKALMITGGCCHDYENQKRIVSEGISARAQVDWTIVHEDTSRRDVKISLYNDKEWAKGYDVIVHNECFGAIKDSGFVDAIAAAHKAGTPAVMLHCSTHSYRAADTDEWRKCLGISSYSHETRRDLLVKSLKPDHPIMQGFPLMWADPADELYKAEKLWPNTIPLAQAYGQDTKKDHTVIWINRYGQGRVFATTLGHENATMESDVYLDLITRGLLWACEKLDDNGKPSAGYGK